MLPIVAAVAAVAFLARGYRVRFKDGVVQAFGPEMARALPLIEAAHVAAGIPRAAVLTSGTDGVHMAGSLHYIGRAADFRTRDLSSSQVSALATAARGRLGPAYDVIIEYNPPHLHIEYDP